MRISPKARRPSRTARPETTAQEHHGIAVFDDLQAIGEIQKTGYEHNKDLFRSFLLGEKLKQ